MNPSQRFRMKEAVMSVLAGDVFRRSTGVGIRLLVFKALYYLFSVSNLGQSIAAWMRRRRAIRDDIRTTTA